MDRDWWLKNIPQLFNVFSASPVNNQIILFNDHASHFYDRELIHMEHQNIQPFILKAGPSVNDQSNDNGPNVNMEYL